MTKTRDVPKSTKNPQPANEDLNYKYNILARLREKKPFRRKEIVTAVCTSSGYEFSTVKRLMYRKADENKTTNFEILEAFAKAFECPIEELKTVKI